MRGKLWVLGLFLLLLAACRGGVGEIHPPALDTGTAFDMSGAPTPGPGTIRGVVVDEEGPVRDAVVRVKTTENKTLTNSAGEFILTGLPLQEPVTVTAWAEGYFVGWVEDPLAVEGPVTISLRPYYTYDNHEYDWFSAEGEDGSLSCSHCMPCYEEWIQDAHSRSAVNERFLSMYNGTDLEGNQSPLTRYTSASDYSTLPLPPNPDEPYYGPGYKLDFPESAGNCATCHVPAQAAHPGQEYQADPNQARGIEKEGVFCEFCHKIGDVTLDPETQLPYPNMPGVLSLQLHRPKGEDQIFFGNFDDVTRRVSKLPLESESAFCAACHYGVFWDVVIYNSYGEWLESPYSDPDTGQTCQECHMPPVDYDYFVYPEKGGEIRDREKIRSHYMPGAADEAFLQDAVDLKVDGVREGDQIRVEVVIINDNTGHKVPTDNPLRNMLLLVEVVGDNGESWPLVKGPRIPDWGGEGGTVEEGYYAGLPGKGFALILKELWTNVSPTGAYWNPVEVVEDTRLDPYETDRSRYVFQVQGEGAARVRVRLLFRRAFKELMDQKGWTDPDILMGEVVLDIP